MEMLSFDEDREGTTRREKDGPRTLPSELELELELELKHLRSAEM